VGESQALNARRPIWEAAFMGWDVWGAERSEEGRGHIIRLLQLGQGRRQFVGESLKYEPSKRGELLWVSPCGWLWLLVISCEISFSAYRITVCSGCVV